MKLNLKTIHNNLGLQSYASQDSGVTILKFSLNMKLEITAISEKRLSKKKYSYSFPAFRSLKDYLKTKK